MPDPSAVEMTADILPNSQGPALSATSDMPSAEAEDPALSAEVNTLKVETAEVETPEAEVESADTLEAVVEPEAVPEVEATEAVVDPAPEPRGVGKKLAALEAARVAAEAKATAADAKLATALKAIEQLSVKPVVETPTPEIPAEAKPKREAFDNPDAYDAALIEWASTAAAQAATKQVEQKAIETKAAETKAANDAAVQADNAKTLATWNERKAAALEQFPDFAEVAESDAVQITIPMSHAILHADNGPAMAYYLGQHPEEAARIAALNPVLQVFEMGKIADKATPKAQITKAPAPVRPLGARQTATQKTVNDMSMDEYAASRLPKLRAERTPIIGATKPN